MSEELELTHYLRQRFFPTRPQSEKPEETEEENELRGLTRALFRTSDDQ